MRFLSIRSLFIAASFFIGLSSSFGQSKYSEPLRTLLVSAIEISTLAPEAQPTQLRLLLKQNPAIIDAALTGELFSDLKQSEFGEWIGDNVSLNSFAPQSRLKIWLMKVQLALFGPSLVRKQIQNLSDQTILNLFKQLDHHLTEIDPVQTPIFETIKNKMLAEPKAAKHIQLLETILPVFYKNLPLETKKKQIIELLKISDSIGAKLDGRFLKVVFENSGIIIQRLSQNIYSEIKDPEIKASIENNLSKIPPMDSEAALSILEKNLGPLGNTFESISPQSIGAGAVAQVHPAKLKNGQKVAVKISRNIKEQLEREFLVFRNTLVGTPFEGIAETYRDEFLKELDLKLEAQNLDEAYRAYENKTPRVKVAKRVSSIPLSQSVLVMEWVDGVPLIEALKEPLTEWQLREIGKALMERYEVWLENALFGNGFFQSDGHFGNIMIDLKPGMSQQSITLIDFGKASRLNAQAQASVVSLAIGFGLKNAKLVANSMGLILKNESSVDKIYEVTQNYFNRPNLNQELMIEGMVKDLAKLGLSIPSETINFVLSQAIMAGQIREINTRLGGPAFDPKTVYQKLAIKHALSATVMEAISNKENLNHIVQGVKSRILNECDKWLSKNVLKLAPSP